MRPASNLKANPDYKVQRAELRQGFLGFYNTRTGTHPYEFIFKLAGATLFSNLGNVEGAPEMKLLRKVMEQGAKDPNRNYIVRSSLRFDAPTNSFEYRTPLFHFLAGDSIKAAGPFLDAAQIFQELTHDQLPPAVPFEQTRLGSGRIMTGRELATILNVAKATKDCVADAIKQVEAEKTGSTVILWVTFRIKQSEAEYLNNTAAREIKLANFYPTLLEWTGSIMGADANLPNNITAISHIAANVQAASTAPGVNVKPRVGLDGMVMDINKNIYVIPVIDRAAEYEQKLMDFGLRDNGMYTWAAAAIDVDAEQGVDVRQVGQRPRLPTNMPIFTDWVNDKFAYSNSAGNLAVYDLSTTVPVSNFHLLQVLNAPFMLENDQVKILANAVNTAARYDRSILSERPTAAELQEIERLKPGAAAEHNATTQLPRSAIDFKMLIEAANRFQVVVGNREDLFPVQGQMDMPRLFQLHHETGLPALRWIGRIIKRALDMLEGNQEAAFAVYSVMNVLAQSAVLRILVNHSPRTTEVVAGDAAERDAYVNQGVDPDYKVGPIALVKKDLKFMPHQAKCDNLMRKHPKSAVYAVAAGGGKTILILTNILREIKDGVCKKPLIMCPPHLVAQYIEEVVYVTEGRLNIIPVTNVSMKAHGEEALEKLISNAPPNTVVVTDYDFVKTRSEDVAYGNKALTVFRNAEFLRKFEFDLVALDESHYLKNVGSNRRDAVARVIQDIPYKRLASGTFVADTIKDVVSQIALIDPTIFGNEDNFKNEFAAEMRGNKVIAWKPGAEEMVRKRIMDHVVYAEAKRKEWAALLPESKEMFYGVELTENQRLLYQSILEETMELIREALASKPELKEAMDEDDESKAEDLERLLRPYMARLERFLSAPDQDPAGQIFLKSAEDHVSPKLSKMYQIIQQHIDEGIPGKVLVFTQYLPTAEAAFLNAPEALRNKGIHYTAEDKLNCRAEFEADDGKVWMVGQSSSMDTGLNFQHVSRLIRLETVWTPGILEQGNSRINRPQLKKEETRTKIYFDWIMINRTIDITKTSRLISKIISKAKFDESGPTGNPAYQQIDNLAPVQMTLDSIAANNDFGVELLPYLQGYNEYESIREKDYQEYREEHGETLDPTPVPPGGMLEGSKLLSRVPYIPGMNLYKSSELGLLRYDQFVRQDIDTVDAADVAEEEDEEETEGEGEGQALTPREMINKANRELRARERVLAKYKPVHTEFGDGEITGIGIKYIRVKLHNGQRVRVHKMRAFVITRDNTNNVDMRNELLKQVGEIPLDKPISVPIEKGKANKDKEAKKGKKGAQPEVEVDNSPEVNLDFVVINDMLFLKYSTEDERDPALSVLQNMGFRISPHYKFAYMPHYRTLLRLFRAWRDKGYKVDPQTSTMFMNVYNTFKTKGKSGLSQFGLATTLKFTNFYRSEIKPSASPTDLKVFPQIEGGKLYVMLPAKGQTANLKAVKLSVMNVRWRDGGGTGEVLRFLKDKEEGKDVLKQILAAGIKIGNLDELKTQYTSMRMGKQKKAK